MGLQLSKRLRESIESLPATLSSIENQEIFNLEDIDTKELIRELTILVFVGQRLALQLAQKKGCEQDMERRREICSALDRYALQFLDDSQEFNDLLDKRGEQYFLLLQSHNEEICRGNWENFFEDLQFKFEQFCRGGGDEEECIFIGSFTSMVPLKFLATQYWVEGFTNTVKYIDEQGV